MGGTSQICAFVFVVSRKIVALLVVGLAEAAESSLHREAPEN